MPVEFHWYIIAAAGIAVLVAAGLLMARLGVFFPEADERTRQIRQKYGRAHLAKKLIRKTIWAGETAEQLRDSFSAPVGIKTVRSHSGESEVWEYVGKDSDHPDLHITLKQGLVVGWVKIYSKNKKSKKR